MNRALFCLVLGMGYCLYRLQPMDKVPERPADTTLGRLAQQMSAEDRQAVSDMYQMLARSIEADPKDDPVFTDTDSVRRAHRAASLCVWKGVLANSTGKYPGLKEALESEVSKHVGDQDVPLNPDLQRELVQTLSGISQVFKK